jgi:hypothetical protein
MSAENSQVTILWTNAVVLLLAVPAALVLMTQYGSLKLGVIDSTRMAFFGLAALGFVMCAVAGMARSLELSGPFHPFTIMGILFGLFITYLIVGVLFKLDAPLVNNTDTAFTALVLAMAAKLVVGITQSVVYF